MGLHYLINLASKMELEVNKFVRVRYKFYSNKFELKLKYIKKNFKRYTSNKGTKFEQMSSTSLSQVRFIYINPSFMQPKC